MNKYFKNILTILASFLLLLSIWLTWLLKFSEKLNNEAIKKRKTTYFTIVWLLVFEGIKYNKVRGIIMINK